METEIRVKSIPSGILVMLPKDVPFETLLIAVKEKFSEARPFFQGSTLAVSFQGRILSQEEEHQLMDAMEETASFHIPFSIGRDAAVEEVIHAREKEIKEAPVITPPNTSFSFSKEQFVHGNISSGTTLEAFHSLVILGNVEEGAKVISTGSVLVLGNLFGSVFAGSSGREDVFVLALSMQPHTIRIGDKSITSHKKPKRFGTAPLRIAFMKEGELLLAPISRDSLNQLYGGLIHE